MLEGSVSERLRRGRRGGGLLSPATFLTKICMVDSGSADEAREEEMEEMLLERMMADMVCCVMVVRCDGDRGLLQESCG
jgi:hypothetical protein